MDPRETIDIDPSSDPTPIGSSARGKSDIAWNHVQQIKDEPTGKIALKCLYCTKVYAGGGIYRLKEHLAQRKGDVSGCKKVPPDVQYRMKCSLESIVAEKQKKLCIANQNDPYPIPVDDDELETQGKSSGHGGNSSQSTKSGKEYGLKSFFAPRTGPGAQPTIKSMLAGQEAINEAHSAVGKWMYDACIPFNAVKSKYFQPMLDAVIAIGSGYTAPSYHDIRGKILKKNVEEIKGVVETFRVHWESTGCTIMADGWTDIRQRTLINFLAYCPRGTVFLKSVDASEHSKTADLLFTLFKDVIEFVGLENVVQVITDNAANYVAAGRLLMQEYPKLYWNPCTAHCIDLMLEDIGKKKPVKGTIERARELTKFIYNHGSILKLMRRFTNGKELIRPAATRFATNFLTLQSLVENRDFLRSMVTCKEWIENKLAKGAKGNLVTELVSNTSFWVTCSGIIKLSEPLVRVLRIVDSDEKPAMGYIYEGMRRAREAIIRFFKGKKEEYSPWIKIIDDRWDKQLHRLLHAAGYWLNPQFFYNIGTFSTHHEIFNSVLDCIEKFYTGVEETKINHEIKLYREAQGNFGRRMAINSRDTLLPADWWIHYGGGTPYLQKMAIRILSQTCSSSGCERNWSVFERIHAKKRNRLEHQRLNDLVYIHYNLRLTQKEIVHKNFDPISLENINLMEDWIVDNDPPLEDIVDEVENWLEMDQPVSEELEKDKENEDQGTTGHKENDNDRFSDYGYFDDSIDI